MIGLYSQNAQISATLCQLLATKGVEPYQSGKTYQLLLWLDSTPAPKIPCPVLCLKDLPLPLSLPAWEGVLNKYIQKAIRHENDTFIFDGTTRQITHKRTKQIIPLTEKENELITFLCDQPNRSATKEDILQNVWQYNPSTQTHTIESHIYSLRQKLAPEADQFIQTKDGLLLLV